MSDLHSSISPGVAKAADQRDVAASGQSLGAVVSAELEALRNDLEQAQVLAQDYRGLLAGKSNECAELRYLLEKTQRDLTKVQNDVSELRKERHRLANEAMKVQLLERYIAENASLRAENAKLEGALHALLSAPSQLSAKPAIEKPPQTQESEFIELDFGV